MVDPVSIYFYFCLVGVAVSIIPFLAEPRIPEGAGEVLIILSMMVISSIAQILMNQGFRYCKSWEGGLFMTGELVFSTLFGILLLGEQVTWRFWIGAMLIFGSASAIHLRHRATLWRANRMQER